MAKVAIKYDNIVPYGGIFYAMNEFRRTGLGKLVDGRLNVRCANYGFQYSDIMLALFCVYLCGGDHIEDITTILDKYLSTAPNARIPSSDTIARGLKELRALSIAYTSKTGSIYAHDPALKLNSLLLDMTLLLGLLKRGQYIDVDFDNEFIPTEKSDALYSYKKKRGYFPGVMTSGPLIIGIENRQGNSNVKFEQVEELSRMLDNIESHGLYVRMFRADCGSFIKELVEELFLQVQSARLKRKELRCTEQRFRLGPPSILNHGGQHGFPSLYRHAEEFLPVLAGQGQRNFPRCRHEKSPEALCLRLHCCPGEMGPCRQTMDSEHLHEGQMVALPDHIQSQLRMIQTFWRGCRL